VEISADGLAWHDIGAYITAGGYNGRVDADAQNSLSGRAGWVGSSDGDNVAGRLDAMQRVTVNVGAAIAALYNGSTSLPGARIRFRLGGTFQVLIGGIQGTGWAVDDISVTGVQVPGSCSTQ
jgi:hypothetical protein